MSTPIAIPHSCSGFSKAFFFLFCFFSFGFSYTYSVTLSCSVPSYSYCSNGALANAGVYVSGLTLGCHVNEVYDEFTLNIPSSDYSFSSSYGLTSESCAYVSCNNESHPWSGCSSGDVSWGVTNGDCCLEASASGSVTFILSGPDPNCSNPQNYLDNLACPLPSCAPTDSAAQALLAAKRAECESSGGEYSGSVVQQGNGSYCVEGSCNAKHIGECPADSPNMLPKRFSQRQLYDEKSQICREPLAEALRQKSGYYYNVKGQRLGSLMAGKPKVRTPLYAREMLRGTAVEELFDGGYRNSGYLRDFLARYNVADSCGMKGGNNGNYGVIEVDGTDTAFIYGITCQRAQVKLSLDTLNYPLLRETNEEKCGIGQNMYRFDRVPLINISMLYAEPEIFVVEAGFVFLGGRTATQAEVDSIQKHEEGHKRDMKCIAQKFPAQKIMFDGCFCSEELESLIQQELDEGDNIHADMFYKADSTYHERYKYSGYPPEEEMDVCPDYIP